VSKINSIFFCFLFLVSGSFIQSQNKSSVQSKLIDSLKAVVKNQKDGPDKVGTLIELATEIRKTSVHEAEEIAKKALFLAQSLKDQKLISRAEIIHVTILSELEKFDEAALIVERSLKNAERSGDKELQANALFTSGNLKEVRVKYEDAIKDHLKALEIRKNLLSEAQSLGNSKAVHGFKYDVASSYLNLGDIYEKNDNLNEAVKSYIFCIGAYKEVGEKHFLSIAYNNIGLVYSSLGNYNKALSSSFDALKLKENLKDEAGIANTYHNIGNVYLNLGNYDEALKNYSFAHDLWLKNNDRTSIVMSYGNIGVAYESKGNFTEALKMYEAALKESIAGKNNDHMAPCYINIGNLHIKEGDILAGKGDLKGTSEKYNEAVKNYDASFKILEQGNDKPNLAILGMNMGVLYGKLKKYDLSKQYLQKSLVLSKELNNLQVISYVYGNFHELDTMLGDYKQAYRHYKAYIHCRDSLVNEESSKKTIEMQMQYDFDKKETETKLQQEKKDAITQKEINHQKQQRNFSLIGIGLVALLAIFILKGYRQKQKANILLEEKNVLIANQKHLVEEKNTEITASITYAKRLQQAILSPEKTLQKLFKESFILYKPKDIVSGDFYWILHIEDKSKNKNIAAFAAADCTGHGVPGAFMSMLNSTLLNQTAYNPNINTPADALNFLNQELPKNLRSADDTQNIKDGMDIAFCLIDFEKNLLQYSGANNPCWIIRDGALIELKPVKQAITASEEYDKKAFVNQLFPLQKNDCIYIFTDGYADQFGGPKGKKFKYRTLSDLLLVINDQTLEKQSKILDQKFLEWKGDLEQVDDVCIIGVRI